MNYLYKDYEIEQYYLELQDWETRHEQEEWYKEQELEDYEAFDLMHKYDGTFTKSESGLSRL
jgi:hypothetical protein